MTMAHTLLVTGGTGRLGTLVTPLLRGGGREIRVLSRRPHAPTADTTWFTGDLRADEGIAPAVDGVDTVVHLAGGAKGDDVAAANLARAAARAGVRHLLTISVVAADRMPLGYFTAKRDAERAIADSGVPWTVLRAAQFHDLVLMTAGAMAKLPVVPVPGGLRFQPVDARDVADRIAELALGAPAGRVPDMAGPRVYGIGELVRGYLDATGKRRLMLPVRLPGGVGRAYRAGDNLVTEGITVGTRTWEDFLAERVGQPVG
jgi:uncharacterized protein YbjT (DUF2867 family)